jgi:hypothetical protein
MIALSVLLNIFGLFLLLFHNPRTQLIGFTSKLNSQFNKNSAHSTIYCAGRNPFITSSNLPITFYANAFKNTEIAMIDNADSIRQINKEHFYLATTFRVIKNQRGMIDSLGLKPVFYSSDLLWKINDFFHTQKMNDVSEVWVLYKK